MGLFRQHAIICKLFEELASEQWWHEYHTLILYHCTHVKNVLSFTIGHSSDGKTLSLKVASPKACHSQLQFSHGDVRICFKDGIKILLDPRTTISIGKPYELSPCPRTTLRQILFAAQENIDNLRSNAEESGDLVAYHRFIAFEDKHHHRFTTLLREYESQSWEHYTTVTWFFLLLCTALGKRIAL